MKILALGLGKEITFFWKNNTIHNIKKANHIHAIPTSEYQYQEIFLPYVSSSIFVKSYPKCIEKNKNYRNENDKKATKQTTQK